jgi:hypothetical protein
VRTLDPDGLEPAHRVRYRCLFQPDSRSMDSPNGTSATGSWRFWKAEPKPTATKGLWPLDRTRRSAYTPGGLLGRELAPTRRESNHAAERRFESRIFFLSGGASESYYSDCKLPMQFTKQITARVRDSLLLRSSEWLLRLASVSSGPSEQLDSLKFARSASKNSGPHSATAKLVATVSG